MALSTYADLQTAVAHWINRTDLTAYIPDFIAIAEEAAYQDLRVRAMEASFLETISGGTISVPSDLIELKHAYIDTTPVSKLERKSFDWILTQYPTRSSDSKPLYIARNSNRYEFGPYPDSNYLVRGVYYKRLEALSATNTSNWLTQNAPTILLFGACFAAAQFINEPDNRLAYWSGLSGGAVKRANAADKREEMSGSTLTMQARSTP